MQGVSDAWKAVQRENIVPMSYLEVSYTVGDPDAQAAASASDNGAWTYSKTAQIVNGLGREYKKYATFELDSWKLDGTFPILPDNVTQDTGFVSSVLSGADSNFSSHPVLTITFATVQTNLIPGVSIKWSNAFGEYATSFKVSVYNGTTLKAEKTITGNTTVQSAIEMDIVSYNKIVVEIISWCLPYHRARTEEVLIGLTTVFSKSDILGFEHNQKADLLSLSLPKADIVFKLSNADGRWNPSNPEGQFKYLLEQQEIVVRYGYKINGGIEWLKAGKFYMSEWDTPSNGITATFTARDLFEFMTDKFSTTSTTLTLYALAVEALTAAKLPLNSDGSVKWILDNCLKNITITMPSNFNYTIAQVLQLCANAACCVIYQDRNGQLHIEPLVATLRDYLIDSFVSYTEGEYGTEKEVKSVQVNVTNNTPMAEVVNSSTGETKTITNPLIQNSTVALAVATWVCNCLKGRKTLSGKYRADPRLDVLDKITAANKYASEILFVTSIEYSYNGAFTGAYEGRVVV